jgi:protein involved in polysaccharide export with SLBB domain
MTIRLASEVRLDFNCRLNLLEAGVWKRWLPVTLAVALIPSLVLAQTPAESPAVRPSPTSSSTPRQASSSSLGAVSAPAGYVLSPNDVVGVEVFGEDDLRTTGRLNPEGNLSVPLLGSIHLAGLTLTQAASKLTELYGREYLVNPRVNVTLLGYAKRRFSVLGQVNRPGSYEMPDGSPSGIDIFEAIAMAGGYTRIAAPERVTVRRHNQRGSDQLFKINAKRLARGEGRSFLVQPGDTVTVGESIF